MARPHHWIAVACLPLFGAAALEEAPLRVDWSALSSGEASTAPRPGEALTWSLDGSVVEISGYALPVDRDGDLVYEFMLVPVRGACSHVAPPPPNQVVLVTVSEPVSMDRAYDRVSVSGRLKPGLEKTQLFIMDGVRVIESGYSLGNARVAKVGGDTDDAPRPAAQPWKFLEN